MAGNGDAGGPKQPPKRAVALRYQEGQDEAPTVVAAGQGEVAERIVAAAEGSGVVVRKDPELAEALSQVDVGAMIPEALYPVVAEVLVFVSRMNAAKGAGKAPGRTR